MANDWEVPKRSRHFTRRSRLYCDDFLLGPIFFSLHVAILSSSSVARPIDDGNSIMPGLNVLITNFLDPVFPSQIGKYIRILSFQQQLASRLRIATKSGRCDRLLGGCRQKPGSRRNYLLGD